MNLEFMGVNQDEYPHLFNRLCYIERDEQIKEAARIARRGYNIFGRW